MTTRYSIRHNFEFRYDAPVTGSVTVLHVSPARGRRQTLEDISIETSPAGPVFDFEGPFGNRRHFFDRHASHDTLSIEVRSRVEVVPPAALPDRLDASSWQALASGARTPERWLMLQPSRFVRMSRSLEQFVAMHGITKGADPLTSVRALRSTLFRVFEYAPGSTTAQSPIEQILETGRGVCQDYAHVMASILRSWGVPTRHASGYLGPTCDDTVPAQAHAWVEPWLPGLGWCGFDPANDCDCDDRHVRVAVGRDYADAPPVRGTFPGDAASTLTTEVAVVRDAPEQADR